MSRLNPVDRTFNMLKPLISSVLLAAAFITVAQAQDLASIVHDIDSVTANSRLDEQTRKTALAILIDARNIVQIANERRASVQAYEAAASSADATVKQLSDNRTKLAGQPLIELSKNKSDSELKALIDDLSAERSSLIDQLGTLRSSQADLASRGEAITSEIAAARGEVEDLTNSPPVADVEPGPIESATTTLYFARLAERQAAVEDLNRERATIAARQRVLEARSAFADSRLERLVASIVPLQDQLGNSRSLRAQSWVEAATQQFANIPDTQLALTEFARENLNLARAHAGLIESNITIAAETRRLQQDLLRLSASAQTVDQVLATGQLNDDTAELLRSVRTRLPNSARLAQATVASDQAAVALRLNLILWQDRLRNLSDSKDQTIASLIEGTDVGATSPVVTTGNALLRARIEYLQALIAVAREKTSRIADLRAVRQGVQDRVDALTTSLDRRLLWLPTKSGFGAEFWKNIRSNFVWLGSGSSWRDTGRAAMAGFGALRFGPTAMLLLAVILVLLAKTIRRHLLLLAQRVGNVRNDTYLTTPNALFLSLLHALPWPLALGALGLGIGNGSTTSFASAIAQGLYAMAAVTLTLGFFRTLVRRNGVFDRHFGWSESSRAMLRRHLNWFIVVEAVVAFVFSAALASGDSIIKYGIGSLAFIVSSVAIAVFAYYLFKPRNGIIVSIRDDREFTGIVRFLFVLLVAAPLTIGLLPIIGYFDAAVELQSRVFQSGVVTLLAAVIYRLLMRLFLVGHRRLALKRAEEKRARAKAQRKGNADADQSGDAAPTISDDKELNLESLSNQSRRAVLIISGTVLFAGLWATWSALLPALGIVDDVILWNGIRHVDGIAVSTGISIWDLAVALIFVFGGFAVARNVGGILELVFFERLTVDSGTRYAAITIAKYVLVSFGIVVGLSRLGLDWSSLQWVIAALGVGLGFGLQEIVANFVSGLIILFERPVRVGDIVTIGQLEGTVTSIKIRATRITDFDNREVLMPNKSIITENVTNWTLNDQVTRIIIRIGVAYGSDIDQVRGIILDAVSSHADTLPTPSPVVFFLAHGDSSLDFEARVFVATPSKRLPVTHDLNRSINLALSASSIEIPFPQRDIHIKANNQEGTS